MKVCPKCKRTWPDLGRFCPMDGTGLEPVAAPPPPAAPVSLAPLEDAREKPTDRVPAARTPTRASVKHTDLRAAKDTKDTRDAKGAPAAAPATPTKQAAARKAARRKTGEFSETGWFVAGTRVPEDEMAAVELPPAQLEEKYRATKELPEEVRKKYSLRYGTPDDEPGRK